MGGDRQMCQGQIETVTVEVEVDVPPRIERQARKRAKHSDETNALEKQLLNLLNFDFQWNIEN